MKQIIKNNLFSHTSILALLVLTISFTANAEDTIKSRFGGATGGILRAPNTNQTLDQGNAFGEAWLKLDFTLWRKGDTVLKSFLLSNYVRDTKPFAYNNTAKIGAGISLAMKPFENLELTFSARHDWFKELKTTTKQKGWRFALDYYYYKQWTAKKPITRFGLTKSATILKSYGTLAYPGSLVEGDTNAVLTLGGELSVDYKIKKSDYFITPFIDTHFSWDLNGNNYNNKIIPAIGVKLRRPIKNGEIFLGVKYEADYRWIDNTINTGPMVFLGWYKGF